MRHRYTISKQDEYKYFIYDLMKRIIIGNAMSKREAKLKAKEMSISYGNCSVRYW